MGLLNRPRTRLGVGVGLCAAMLIVFSVLSYSAARTKSATYDESLHAVAGYVRRTTGDFRMNPEDPALFGYWASIPHGSTALNPDYLGQVWTDMPKNFSLWQWPFAMFTLFRTPGTDGDAFIQKSRFMFVIVGVGLGALIAWWSWQLAGMWAAVIATALFAFDPNFMAHSSIVKNDVMLSFMMCAMAMALWRFGRRGTIPSLVGLTLATAGAVNVKFSGVIFGPIIFVALLIRALLPMPWNVAGKTLQTRGQRLLVVPAVCFVVGLVSWIAIWACYGLKFTPTHDPKVLLNDAQVVLKAKFNLATLHNPGPPPTEEMIAREAPGALVDLILRATSMKLLPQAWLHGFMFTYASTIMRGSYLLGEVANRGWWYYFPCTMLFKTPTATLVAFYAALVGAAVVLLRTLSKRSAPAIDWWTVICLVLPVGFYLLSAMSANLNLGLRHMLPVYPFLFVALGAIMAVISNHAKRAGPILAGVIVLGLAVESISAYPNFIPFFNTPSILWRGKFYLLGDSNLDWGQDLKLLAEWQKEHPGRLYLNYFGIADPAAYGVVATHMPGSWPFAFMGNVTPRIPAENEQAYVAISATNLQGIYDGKELRDSYQMLLNYTPTAVLGDSIYIYQFPLTPDRRKPNIAR